jgi:hypothetical protein
VGADKPSSSTRHGHGYTADQSKALDEIGNALKHGQIDFYIATKLRDLVKAGQLHEVRERLRRFRRVS